MDREVVYQVIKRFYMPTNPEISVKIGPTDFEIPGLESRSYKKGKKNIGEIYRFSGKFAEPCLLCQLLSKVTDTSCRFLPRDAMLARYMPSSCVCVCVCHTPVLYQNG